VVTRALSDFGEMEKLPGADARTMKVPAPLLCYWIGQAEWLQKVRLREGRGESCLSLWTCRWTGCYAAVRVKGPSVAN